MDTLPPTQGIATRNDASIALELGVMKRVQEEATEDKKTS